MPGIDNLTLSAEERTLALQAEINKLNAEAAKINPIVQHVDKLISACTSARQMNNVMRQLKATNPEWAQAYLDSCKDVRIITNVPFYTEYYDEEYDITVTKVTNKDGSTSETTTRTLKTTPLNTALSKLLS